MPNLKRSFWRRFVNLKKKNINDYVMTDIGHRSDVKTFRTTR